MNFHSNSDGRTVSPKSFKISEDAKTDLDRIGAEMEQSGDQGPDLVSLDLENVGLIDSMLLAQFLKLHMRLRRRGCQIELINVPFHAHRYFSFARLDRFFPISGPGGKATPSASGLPHHD
ncbi:STAS domain-containing protein [Candidatus Sumerlaeota bacterium]|nr:STAS domain-containing protein [Candidatus Sumerlaeota bacterium]